MLLLTTLFKTGKYLNTEMQPPIMACGKCKGSFCTDYLLRNVNMLDIKQHLPEELARLYPAIGEVMISRPMRWCGGFSFSTISW